MKIILSGGSGQVGTILARAFHADGHEVVVLSRTPQTEKWRVVEWNGRTTGGWVSEIDGADVVINLVGRSVNCRYNDKNRQAMVDSRILSTRVIGEAIGRVETPPAVWLQASTATLYAHRFDAPNDEITGIIGGHEPDAPDSWNFSIHLAHAWENELDRADTPRTRKIKLRSAMTMSPDKDGVFDAYLRLVRVGLGGWVGRGNQYVSWIHEVDFINAIYWLIEQESLDGAINLASPNPLPNRAFMRILRDAWGIRFGLPATAWMAEIGAFFLQTETELILKSRRVIPTRLTESGFSFQYADWADCSAELVGRWREENS